MPLIEIVNAKTFSSIGRKIRCNVASEYLCGIIHNNETRYEVMNKTQLHFILISISDFNMDDNLVFPRVNCIPEKENSIILEFLESKFPFPVHFATTIKKYQRQSVAGKPRITLRLSCWLQPSYLSNA